MKIKFYISIFLFASTFFTIPQESRGGIKIAWRDPDLGESAAIKEAIASRNKMLQEQARLKAQASQKH